MNADSRNTQAETYQTMSERWTWRTGNDISVYTRPALSTTNDDSKSGNKRVMVTAMTKTIRYFRWRGSPCKQMPEVRCVYVGGGG